MGINLSSYAKEAKKDNGFNINISLGRQKSFSDKKKEAFYRELGMLLKAGVDFKKALEILSLQQKKKVDSELISGIKNMVVGGKSISDSMLATGQFSSYEYFSIQIGEETHRLEEVLYQLQLFFFRKIQMRRQIVSVLTYPTIVMVVTFLVLYFMLTKVVPMFSSVFRQFNSELPKSTLYIIKLSENSGLFFSICALVLGVVLIGNFLLKGKPFYRKFTSTIVINIPYFGKLIRKIYLSRFCQAMNLLLASRTQLINSLTLTERMINFYPLEYSIKTIIDDITKGKTISHSLKRHKIYEDRMVSMIEVAEQVNQLDIMFKSLSEQYNEEINHETKMIGVILEPMIIIIIGIVVGIIMISMYAPMFDLSKIIRN